MKVTSAQIKKIMKEEDVVIGTERTMKKLKLGKVKKVLMSSNVPENVEKSVDRYTSLSGTEAVKLKYPNDELGVICRKPFSISIFGILKG